MKRVIVVTRPALIIACVLLGCATAHEMPAPKMPFDEAMRDAPVAESLEANKSSSPLKARAPFDRAQGDVRLASAMRELSQIAHEQRKRVMRGAPMTAAHVEAWGSALDEVDAFVRIAPRASSILDTVRTRLQLETEIQTDGSAYGDVPPLLTERVQSTLQALSVKLSEQTALTHSRRSAGLHLQWPVLPVIVTSPYGDRIHPIIGEYRFHSGTDLAADPQQSVLAAEAGVVVFSGWNGGHGKSIEVQHADGHTTTRYSHLDSLEVGVGEKVKRGDEIGLAGKTGFATGVHVHFEIRRDGEAIDPEFLMGSGSNNPNLMVNAR